jgi:hypothetical protein
VAEVEIVARVERRRKWTIEEKAALLAEVEAEGGKVKLAARRPASRKACCTTGARPGRQRRVLRSAHRERSRSCRWACWMQRAARHRPHERQRNRSDRTSVARAEPGRSRSPCRTAPASASMPVSMRRRCRACFARCGARHDQPGAGDEGVPRLQPDRSACRVQRLGGESPADDRAGSFRRQFVYFPR